MKIQTLIVDDQLIAQEVLRRLLKDDPDIEIVGMPASGGEAAEAIDKLAPDLAFRTFKCPIWTGLASWLG